MLAVYIEAEHRKIRNVVKVTCVARRDTTNYRPITSVSVTCVLSHAPLKPQTDQRSD